MIDLSVLVAESRNEETMGLDQMTPLEIVAAMNREEKVLAIRFMEQKGLFLIKGVVDKVAARMGISKVTVYSYLDEIRDGGEA